MCPLHTYSHVDNVDGLLQVQFKTTDMKNYAGNMREPQPKNIKEPFTGFIGAAWHGNHNATNLNGIDLSNHAGVVIVDFLPESSSSADIQQNRQHASFENTEDDGFQQVMTKKGKKAEKLKAATISQKITFNAVLIGQQSSNSL